MTVQNERRKKYIEARDLEGNLVKKTALQWSYYWDINGNPDGNSVSAISKRNKNKGTNGLTNQQIVDFSQTGKKVRPPHIAKKKPIDCSDMRSRFNRTLLAG